MRQHKDCSRVRLLMGGARIDDEADEVRFGIGPTTLRRAREDYGSHRAWRGSAGWRSCVALEVNDIVEWVRGDAEFMLRTVGGRGARAKRRPGGA